VIFRQIVHDDSVADGGLRTWEREEYPIE